MRGVPSSAGGPVLAVGSTRSSSAPATSPWLWRRREPERMGQKVHPIGFRLGVKVGDRSVKDWEGRWFATGREYSDLLLEDIRVRQHIMTRMADAGVAKVEIERSANMITVTIHAAKPGIVIGKSGVKVEELRRTLEAMTGKRIRVTIQEIRQPETNAMLVARSIADQ